MCKLVSRKEAKVLSEKYTFSTKNENYFEDMQQHKAMMKREGYKVTKEKYIRNAWLVTYVKYTSL
ncbi:hypothetical protein [Priestia aryabhattai]|uniref:hypothetical protein n=1 Tax=Priestia aryabhattai TaxID=412384 RepID=UPI0015F3E734|nr:hypothetical protein [Priestia aryabhattai]